MNTQKQRLSLLVVAAIAISILSCVPCGQLVVVTPAPSAQPPLVEATATVAPPTRAVPTSPAPTAKPSPAPTAKPSLGPEVRIGIVYPLSGRLETWGKESQPFIKMAEADINALPETIAAGRRFRFIVRSSGTTGEGALAAVKDLVEKEGIQVIAGFPMSAELKGAIEYLTQHHVAVISSASTSPEPALRQPDTIYRIAPPELYLARTLAQFALHLGYRKAAIIYRTDNWGPSYAEEVASTFKVKGYPTAMVPITPTHPKVGDYAAEVAQLSAQVAKLGADKEMVVFMAVWEGKDLNILHHAAQDPTLSSVRWLSAILYPSLLNGQFEDSGFNLPDACDFALAHNMWGQEAHPPMNELVQRLWKQAKTELGQAPRFEHVYLYDAMQIAARAVLLAGTADGDAVATAIPAAAKGYNPATGAIRFDKNGDRASGDLAYYGLFRKDDGQFEYRYYAYFYSDSPTGRFEILPQPEHREVQFCPEC